jgi:hypothetical protein
MPLCLKNNKISRNLKIQIFYQFQEYLTLDFQTIQHLMIMASGFDCTFQSINQSMDEAINQSMDGSINQSSDQSINGWVNQSIKRSIHESLCGLTRDFKNTIR